jgi:hypothetical protein
MAYKKDRDDRRALEKQIVKGASDPVGETMCTLSPISLSLIAKSVTLILLVSSLSVNLF